ncbi:M16 family metallopeptidase [Cellulophaga tyrosinoxydans]|uniref:Predicted Zn-dependent peptidase n=1 Tax=Cellulophaga tyrosinoxydans TaxID=504486 RepID=A0A1W2BLT7_9FLAO|nr:pitrilysin family protein [Cellulophaga tyrosinoxydans]SMC73804.1 Predicted Zn-dependent peptidase [Cellulophaga tyrosinoxydans]
MKNTINKLFVFFVALLLTNSIVAQEDFKLPEYTKIQLKNGLTIYLMERHEVPLIQFTAVFPAGAVNDVKEKSGLAAVTADALVLGSKNYTKSQIEENTEFLGASISSGAGKESAYLVSSFMKKDQKVVMDILKDVLLNPTFPTDEVEKMVSRKIAEMDQMKESPRSVLSNYYNKFVFGEHPYGNPEEGTKASLQQIQNKDLINFYKEQYNPSKSAIAIVGDFNTKSMKVEVEKLFGAWKSSAKTGNILPDLPVTDKARVLLVNKEDARETTFYIGGPGISRNNPDFVGIRVINTILGGRFTSWLNDELRVNSGLTYGARSSFTPYKLGGTFVISTFTANENTEKTIDLALETYKKLHTKGLDEEILTSAKNYVKGQFPPDYETNSALSILLTDMYIYDFDESYINTFTKQVDALNTQKAAELIQKYFPKDNFQFVLIGKASEIGELAKKYGEVEQLEITNDGF